MASTKINDSQLSTIDADTINGLSSSSFLRSNANDSHSGDITPNTDNARTLGSASLRYSNIYAVTFRGNATSANYADLAEMYAADTDIEPGTVVMIGGEAEVTTCMIDHCSNVIGVVSTDPAHLMNAGLTGMAVAVALRGRIPCKVQGIIKKGDMLVSAGNGCARAENNPRIGAVIGKALSDYDGTEPGIIEIVV